MRSISVKAQLLEHRVVTCMKGLSLFRTAVLALLLFSAVPILLAQGDTARLQGTVTDPQGTAIISATVTVNSVETGRTVTVQTNELGYYSVPALPPGHYRVDVVQEGFQSVARTLELQVAQIGVADFQLAVGAITQSVTVESGSPIIDTADSALGEVVESRQVTELPLNGRNFTQLATLVTGVSRGIQTSASSASGANNNAETFRYGQEGGASLVVNGLRPQNNNFSLDGIDNNEALVNTIVFFPPADAIDEFRVQTNLAPAEFGRAGGALVITSLKSGSNDWHGSAFEFNRNTNLNARDFFDTQGRTPRYNRNQFGGTIGFPIIKNKLFIFGDYQGLRLQQPNSPAAATVPTDLMRQGNFSELLAGAGPAGNPTGLSAPIQILDPATGQPLAGNVLPTNEINPVGTAYLKLFPEPNCNNTTNKLCSSIYNNFFSVSKIIENWNDFDVRADYIINTTNSIFGRFSRGRADQTKTTLLPNLPSCAGFGCGTNFNHPYGASIGWTHTFNSSAINEGHIGFVRTYYGFLNPDNNVPICTQIGIVNCNTSLLGGIALIGGYNTQLQYTGDYGPYLVPQTGYNGNDTLTWTKGKHIFKFGTNILRRQLNLYRPLTGKGYFFLSGNGTGAGGFSSGHVNTDYEVSDVLAGFFDGYQHGPTFGMVGTRTWENAVFAQDDWRMTPRLTLNLGLRYDVLTWPVEVNNRQANFNLQTGAIDIAGQNGNSASLVNNNYNDFGPRLGFAYQLTRDGKTVLRGGYGIFYFLDRAGVSNQLAQNPPFSGQNSVSYQQGFRITFSGALPCQPNCSQAQLISPNATGALPSGNFTDLNLTAPSNVSLIAVLPNNATPRVTQWNLQVQHQLDANSYASLGYVGTRGEFLTRAFNANQQLYGVSSSNLNLRFPNLGTVQVLDNHGNSIYHSLQAQYEHRFHSGFQFLGAMTWSKDIDDSCGALDSCAPQLYTNYRIERGLSNIDQRYRLVLSGLYELPFGRGRMFGRNWSRLLDWAIGGWQLNGIYALQAGLPFSVTVNGSPNATRADLVGKASVNPGSLNNYISETAQNGVPAGPFTVPAVTGGVFNTPGTSGRDILVGPGSSNIDMSIFKTFQLTERFRAELRAQAYNLTNTPHFANPNSNLSNIGNNQFGFITSTIPFQYRQGELGVRLTF
jgi:Carboxypeptidase regulatory-like domain